VDHTYSCASIKDRWTLASRVCINDSMVGLSPGTDFSARAEYSIWRLGTKRQYGRTPATSESSRTLSSGLSKGRPKRLNDRLGFTGCLSDCVGATAAVPRIAANLRQRPGGQPRATPGNSTREHNETALPRTTDLRADVADASGQKQTHSGRPAFLNPSTM